MGCRRWWIMVPRSHVEIATQSLDTAKDTSQKSEPMQRSWCSQPSRTPWSWLDAVQSHMRTQGSVELGNRRYLIIQVPALYVDNQNPQIGLKASKAQTCKVQRDICQNMSKYRQTGLFDSGSRLQGLLQWFLRFKSWFSESPAVRESAGRILKNLSRS